MDFPKQIAKHLRDVHAGGNWTAVNLKDTLADVTWQEATTQIGTLHSIAAIVFHMNYFVRATIPVLQGGVLNASDTQSFDCPRISSDDDWQSLLSETWASVEELASLIERLPQEQLGENFADAQYGSYYRCLQGPIEHCHYHLGQIVVIKALLRDTDDVAEAVR